MRSALVLSAIAGVAALAAGAAHAASPADGVWRTPEKHGVVEVFDCGGALCARIVTSDTLKVDPQEKDLRNKDPSLRSRPMKGLVVIWGMTGGPPSWKGGQAYDPDDGRIYTGSLRLVNADTLSMTGCIVFPLCRSETWKRAH